MHSDWSVYLSAHGSQSIWTAYLSIVSWLWGFGVFPRVADAYWLGLLCCSVALFEVRHVGLDCQPVILCVIARSDHRTMDTAQCHCSVGFLNKITTQKGHGMLGFACRACCCVVHLLPWRKEWGSVVDSGSTRPNAMDNKSSQTCGAACNRE